MFTLPPENASCTCEVWGFTILKLIEKLRLQFCKHVLCAKKINSRSYGKLGRFPLSINVKVRMVTFLGEISTLYLIMVVKYHQSCTLRNRHGYSVLDIFFIEYGLP